MNNRDLKFSKFLSLVLRHKPEKANLTLDKNGYANVEKLIKEMNKLDMDITREDLDRIVEEDDKQRYSYDLFNTERTIRANHGHSIPVDLELKPVCPLSDVYHGTAKRFLDKILKEGLNKQNRQYVHLTTDIEMAKKVGKRYGEPVILKIDDYNMMKDGYDFYCSESDVYLTDNVPVKYIKVVEV